MWNLLDYAGVTVPVTRADWSLDSVGGGLDAEWEGHSIRNESDAFNYLQCETSPENDNGREREGGRERIC
jgi:hypothetical protein